MLFAEKKFRALPAHNQAKKLADLLATALLNQNKPDTLAECLREYKRLLGFIEIADTNWNAVREVRASSAHLPQLYEAYLFWRRTAGLGPEQRVLTALSPARNSETVAGTTIPAMSADREQPRSPAIDYAVWLHNIRSGYNTGAVLRTAECFGFRAAYLSGFTPGPEQRAVRAAAMGCEAWINCRRIAVESNTITANDFELNDAGSLIVLESPETQLPANARARETISVYEYNWPTAAVLVVGNEELGVPAEILARADAIVTIPMYGRKASLNLASSFAIAAALARESLQRRRRK